jgi:hypothetical protein
LAYANKRLEKLPMLRRIARAGPPYRHLSRMPRYLHWPSSLWLYDAATWAIAQREMICDYRQ